MAQNSNIEWTTHTANLWWGCTKVHAGCDNCYAERLSERFGDSVWGKDNPRRLIKSFGKDLAKYQRLAAALGEKHRVFVGSMMDIFEKPMPLQENEFYKNTGEARAAFFNNIDAGEYPNLIFLLLTKRPSNIHKYVPPNWIENPPENIFFGTSVSDQKSAKDLIPELLKIKGKKFISLEPQIAEVYLEHIVYETEHEYITVNSLSGKETHANKLGGADYVLNKNKLDWVIQGGESGPGKRPFNIGWAYDVKDMCETFGVPYFFKQIDKVKPVPKDLSIRQFPS